LNLAALAVFRPKVLRQTGPYHYVKARERIRKVNSSSRQERQHRFQHTGETVRKSGTYRVLHSEHRLPSEVTLMEGHVFPDCEKCSSLVKFQFLRAATNAILQSGQERFRVIVHSLPVLDDEDESESKAG
jgi:hypothetical protein